MEQNLPCISLSKANVHSPATVSQQQTYDNVVHSPISIQAKSDLIFNQSLYTQKSHSYMIVYVGPSLEKNNNLNSQAILLH